MTNLSAITSLRANAPLRNLAIFAVLVLVWVAFAFGWTLWAAYADVAGWQVAAPSRLQILSAYLAPATACLFTVLLIRIGQQGDGLASRSRFWVGSGFIAGAAVLDLSVTFYFSPDLVDEGNPVVRALLDSGHTVPWVITHMLLTTLAVVAAFSAFWAAFLAHELFLLRTIHEDPPENWIDFLKAATGGARLSLRQWLFPYRWSELPTLYHGVWMAGVAIVFGITVFRYYVSLEWLGLFEPAQLTRLIVLFIDVAGSLICYYVMLARDYQKFARTN